jgi:small subunit ribosomal protein S6
MYVLNPEMEEEATTALIDRISGVITGQGGTVDNVDQWGKRRLAYEVDGLREGYYVLTKFKGGPSVASELDRVLRITDEVARHVILREDAK